MFENKDAYVRKLKAKIDEWNAEIDKLMAKADQAGAEAKIKYRHQLDDLRVKRKEVEDRLAALQEAGESSWEGLKHGIERSWDTWMQSFTKAKSEFEEGYKDGKKKKE